MGFKCGIVGLPNVGKSTLFNALTKAGVEAANYPFCTIEPNVGIVAVPDERLHNIARIAQSKVTIPTTVKFVDIAGLVAGAAKGEGLGNKFLANIRETQAIAHVVRCFDNNDVTHVAGKIDPLSDIAVIETELALADLESLEKAMLKVSKDAKRGEKEAQKRLTILEKLQQNLNEGKLIRCLGLAAEELMEADRLQLLTAKPVMYIANVNEKEYQHNPYYQAVVQFADEQGAVVVPICATIEAEIVELLPEEQIEFLQSLGMAEPGLNRVIRAGHELLGLETFFTVGPKEARAWTIPKQTTAVQAAGEIHTDFIKGFIRAEVISYEDYMKYQGEQGAKEAGRWRLEGKEYVVCDGDVMLFRVSA